MTLPFNEFQDDLFERLSANVVDLDAAAVPVKDEVPDNTSKPYVELDGFDVVVDESKDDRVFEVTYVLNAYSDYPGTKEVNSILSQIDTLLTQPFQPDGSVRLVGACGFLQSVRVERETSPEDSVARRGTLSVLFRLME